MKEEAFYIHNFPRFKFNLIHDQLEENLPYTWNDFNGWIGSSCIPEDFISSLSSPKSKTTKIPSGFVFVSFLCRRRMLFWLESTRSYRNHTNDKRQTRLQINIIQDTKPEGLLLTMMMTWFFGSWWRRRQQTSHTSTSTIMVWNASSIHTLIRLIFKSRSLSFSLSSDSWALMKWWWSWSIVIGHGTSNKNIVSTSPDFGGCPEEVIRMGNMKR